jgi:hypothetical protein
MTGLLRWSPLSTVTPYPIVAMSLQLRQPSRTKRVRSRRAFCEIAARPLRARHFMFGQRGRKSMPRGRPCPSRSVRWARGWLALGPAPHDASPLLPRMHLSHLLVAIVEVHPETEDCLRRPVIARKIDRLSKPSGQEHRRERLTPGAERQPAPHGSPPEPRELRTHRCVRAAGRHVDARPTKRRS